MRSMNEATYYTYLKELMAIDSATGHYHEIQDYLLRKAAELGYRTETYHKGGVLVDLGGEGNGLVVSAHVDDIGLMVRHINADGTLKVCKVGGLYAYHAERENVRIYTSSGRVLTGVLQRDFSSVHVTPDDKFNEKADFDRNVFVLLDEDVHSAEDVRALGIEVGDFVELEPRLTFSNGYLKSHFLDDKAQAAILLYLMDEFAREKPALSRKVWLIFGMYEEIGHGTTILPEGTKDYVAVDIACVGPEQTSSEKKVSIFCKDSRFPYHIDMVRELEMAAREAGAAWVKDIFTPHYGTDADPALAAGYDIRHGAIGPGVVAKPRV